MGICMEDTTLEQLLGVDVDQHLGDPVGVQTGVQEPLAVGDLDALYKLHDQQALRVHTLDDLGYEDVFAVADRLFQVRDGRGLAPEVQLHRERPAKVVQDRLQVYGGFEA